MEKLAEMRRCLRTKLLQSLASDGHWEGHLASSALSTATAVAALHKSGADSDDPVVVAGLDWLARHSNRDGGWGDTTVSISNISTTALAWAALGLSDAPLHRQASKRAETWLAQAAGSSQPDAVANAILQRYAEDRTFSVPILSMLALCGRLGQGREAWQHVMPLPFELAAVPRAWFHRLQLPVVSYALPALIAIGQAIFYHRGAGNPVTGLLRRMTQRKTLQLLQEIQPSNGGFLEAIPLTAFVTMNLASMGLKQHPVVQKGRAFLQQAARPDGSWPIDTHLATWVTTLSVKALVNPLQTSAKHHPSNSQPPEPNLTPSQKKHIVSWLLAQQYRDTHPYTMAAPGGWSWTPLPGGVPDADDTSGAIVALALLAPQQAEAQDAAKRGLDWLCSLQNRDGGIPTFCNGWGRLPFDRSCCDISAHTLQAIASWQETPVVTPKHQHMALRILTYLNQEQRSNGSWLPLWFGNQHHPQHQNPIYGTARVTIGLAQVVKSHPQSQALIQRGIDYLLAQQNQDGGWGGSQGLPSSLEETSQALEAINTAQSHLNAADRQRIQTVREKSHQWIAQNLETSLKNPEPIGFYFASLWYWEKLYPLIFAAAALK